MTPTSVIWCLIITLVNFTSSKTVFDNTYTLIRNKPTFVDKTPLIYEFLQHKYLFISAPSKFGKSTNLDMLNLFLSNHRPKSTIEDYFIWTKIWENEDFVKNNIGQYPVIYFNLKVRGYSTNFDRTLTGFKVSLYNAFIDHSYLLESETLDKERIKLLGDYTDLTGIKLMDTEQVAKGLGFLTECLYIHYRKPVILLADEFGRGITEGILQTQSDLKLVVDLYSSILNNTFYNETIISHALLSGENRIQGIEGISETFERVSFMQKVEFSRFYGITYDEVKSLLPKFNMSNDKKIAKDIFEWYCGYSSADGLFKICNPYSTLQYLMHKSKIVYWTGAATATDLIRKMLDVESLKKAIIDLVMKKPVEIDLDDDNYIFDIEFFSKKVQELPQYCESFFLEVLLEAGYLTYSEQLDPSKKPTFVFPNEEVRSAIIKYTI